MSFKQHLRRVVGEVRLTYEELATVLAQVETYLNSEPLTHLSRTVRRNRSINARAFPHWVKVDSFAQTTGNKPLYSYAAQVASLPAARKPFLG